MMFKNSTKLLLANFDKVWKLLVYHILCFAVCFGLLAIFYNFFVESITQAWQEANLSGVFVSGTFYGYSVSGVLHGLVNAAIGFFATIFAENVGIGIYFCLIVFFLLPFLMNIGKYVVDEMLYGFMSSAQKQSFTGTFLRTLGKSTQFAAIKTLYAIPFNALIFLSLYGLSRIQNEVFDYILPLAIALIPALLFAFKQTFNAGWAPAMVVFDVNVAKAYAIGNRAMLRRGARVFSTAFVICLLAIVLSLILGLYALIIILPIVLPFSDIFEMTAFFSSQGMRFYADYDTILTPKKLEEVDKIENAKFIL